MKLDEKAVTVLFYAIGAYDILATMFGTVGSILVLVVASRLRKTTTFVFVMFLAIADALTLYGWNLDDFSCIFFDYSIQSGSIYGCVIVNYFQYSSAQSSAWLLIFTSVDRFMSVWLKTWKRTIFKPKHAFMLSSLALVIFFSANLCVVFKFGYRQYTENGTFTDYCQSDSNPSIAFITAWTFFHSAMYAYIPYAVLVATNVALIVFLTARQKRRLASTVHIVSNSRSSRKKSSANRMVIVITALFVVLSFPTTVGNNFYSYLIEQDWGMTVVYLSDSCDFTYHALTFPVLMLTNTRFRQEFFALFGRLCPRWNLQSTARTSALMIANSQNSAETLII